MSLHPKLKVSPLQISDSTKRLIETKISTIFTVWQADAWHIKITVMAQLGQNRNYNRDKYCLSADYAIVPKCFISSVWFKGSTTCSVWYLWHTFLSHTHTTFCHISGLDMSIQILVLLSLWGLTLTLTPPAKILFTSNANLTNKS